MHDAVTCHDDTAKVMNTHLAWWQQVSLAEISKANEASARLQCMLECLAYEISTYILIANCCSLLLIMLASLRG